MKMPPLFIHYFLTANSMFISSFYIHSLVQLNFFILLTIAGF